MNVACINELYNCCMPIHCAICGSFMPDRSPLCDSCCSQMPHVAPLDISITRSRYLSVAAATSYEAHIVWHVTGKHRTDVAAACELGWLISQRCHAFVAQADIIVPVSLHWRRRWQRGYDQAHVIARNISRNVGIAQVNALRRTRWDGSQAGKSGAERQANVKHAFAWDGTSHVRGLHICLVDDVMAYGATLAEAARTLYKHSAVSVRAVVAARSV